MSKKNHPAARGRPKKLERDQVLNIALLSYWTDGPTSVSIGDICNQTGVSKPAVYREFGSVDGLKVAVLEDYEGKVLAPMRTILSGGQPFEEALDALISFTVQDRHVLGVPTGCLLVAMRAHWDELGEAVRDKVSQMRGDTLEQYEKWIERAKVSGEFRSDIPSNVAALYIRAQTDSAMHLQKEGVSNDTIEHLLKLAFCSFR